MEIKGFIWRWFPRAFCLCTCILLCCMQGDAQPVVKNYFIRDGRMVIELGKQVKEKDLDEFIKNFDLADLDLKNFLKTNKTDSLRKLGWLVEINNKALLVLSKPLFSLDMQGMPSERIVFSQKPPPSPEDILPLTVTEARYGYNKFRNKYPFHVRDSIVVFFLRGYLKADQVLLAGSFTNWQQGALRMTRTDSGWIVQVKLSPGKHWYKFIAGANWMTDPDNLLNENDGRGNVNSVYYKTNVMFALNGSTDAGKVYLAGSFNDWREKELLMQKTVSGWQLPMYIATGTHTYKFIIDGNWYADPKNPNKLPDGAGGFNSVVRIGQPHLFKLNDYTNARQVVLSGSFNGWKTDELYMNRTATGWELPYVAAPGNYEYKFIVDGEWIADPANLNRGNDGNSLIIIHPNYTFRLKAPNAKKVNIAGDFNDWNPNALVMKKDGDYWSFSVYLSPGKHQYKFLVDGEWIRDPANKLWEQNEFGTGNSVVWIGQ